MTVQELLSHFTTSTRVEIYDLCSLDVLYEGENDRYNEETDGLEVESAFVHRNTLCVNVMVETTER